MLARSHPPAWMRTIQVVHAQMSQTQARARYMRHAPMLIVQSASARTLKMPPLVQLLQRASTRTILLANALTRMT